MVNAHETNSFYDRLMALEKELKEARTAVAELDTKLAVAHVQRDNVEKRLFAIEDTLRWLVRLIVSFLLLSALGFIVAGGLVL